MASPRRRQFLFGLVVVSLAITGAVAISTVLDDGTAADSDPFAENASERLAAIDSVSATRTTVIERGNETRRTVERVRLDPDTGGVWRQRVTGPGDIDRRISNGTTLWLYDRDEETVTRLDQQDGPGLYARFLDRIPALVATLNRASNATTTPTGSPPSGAPLPVVPAGETGQSVPTPTAARGSYTVTATGTATVDGRSVLKLTLERTGSEPVAAYRQTLWLDEQWYFPVRTRTAWTQGGQRTIITTTYSNLTINPGLDPSLFQFDPPEDVTVETPTTPDQQQFDSLSSLRRASNMTIPEPTLPESYVLEKATRTTGRIGSIGLRYVNATSVVTVTKLDTVIPPTSEGEPVIVDGQIATYRVIGAEHSLVWDCGGGLYKVRGRGLPRSTLVEIADSVGCPSQ
jgi:outer membrane lipoprotein-sorting protein